MAPNPSSVDRTTPLKRCLSLRPASVLLFVLASIAVSRCFSSGPSGPAAAPHSAAGLRRVQRSGPSSTPCPAAAAAGNATDLESVRVRRVNTIREEILKKLRMESAPNITIDGRELRTMRRIIGFSDSESQTTNADDEAGEEANAGPVIVIVQSRTVPAAGFNSSSACYFKFPDDLTDPSQVINATLGVHLRTPDHTDRSSSSSASSSLRLVVRKNVRRSDPVVYRRKRIQQQQQQPGSGGRSGGVMSRWQTVDVRSLVQSWINEPNGNVGLTIAISDAQGQQATTTTAIVQPRNPQEETLRPFIELRMKPAVLTPGRRRRERSTGGGGGGGMDCNENSLEPRCCRYPLTIDFEEFRWDWIMVPKRYEAFYCSGKCNQFHFRSSSRTVVQSQVSSLTIDACCAATEVAPLSIIHLNEKSPGYIHTSLPGMVVKQCGCL